MEQAPVIPVYFHLISRWIPECERSLSTSFIMAGYGVGAFVSNLASGFLCASDFLDGWPSVFYLGGICGFSWCFLCYLFISGKPHNHPSISKDELKFITENLGETKQMQIEKIPWKQMLLSGTFWALVIGYVSQFFILGFYNTSIALYMGTILNIDTRKNGELSCLVHFVRAFFACLCGYPTDWAMKKGYVSKVFVRKGATTINSLFACLGFVAITLANCSPVLNTVIFTVGGLFGDFFTFGVSLAGLDIAPNLSGTVSGILSFFGVIPFIVIPALIGVFTEYEQSKAQWKLIYYTMIGVISLTTLVYVFFGSSEPQDWGMFDKLDAKEVNEDSTAKHKSEDK